VWREPGTERRRVELVEGSDGRYDLTVSNGSTLWLYDRDRATVKRIPLSGRTGTSRGERIEQLFASLNVTTRDGPTAVRAGPTVSPLPVVPRAGGPTPAPGGVARVGYDGTATVDGREAYVLSVSAGTGAGAYRQTLWIDTEWFYPLQKRTEWTDDGERVSVRTTVRNVTFDPDHPEAVFGFDPPESASVEAVGTPRTTTYGSVGTLQDETSIAVPEPNVPASFGLTYASQTEGQVRGVGLRYTNETSRLTVAKYNRTVGTDGDRQVRIAGREAQLTLGSPLSLSWTCGEFRYTVRGERVSVDRLVGVGRSVGCP
jgi:outer membrane lipoprotein-sorting protein